MPYFNFLNAEDEEAQKAGQEAFGGGLSQPLNTGFSGGAQAPQANMYTPPPQPGSSSGRTPGAPAVGGGDPYTPAVASGSDFVNYGQYVNANKDVSARNAKDIAGKIENTAHQGSQELAGVLGKFQGDVTAATPTYNATQVNQGVGQTSSTLSLRGNGPPTGRNTATTTSAPVPSNLPTSAPTGTPTGTTSQRGQGLSGEPQRNVLPQAPGPSAPGSREELEKLATQGWQGPTSLSQQEGYDAATGKMGQAAGQMDAIQTKDGLSGYLSKEFGGTQAGYGAPESGARELDSLLIGRAGGDRFKKMKEQYEGFGKDNIDFSNRMADNSVNAGKAAHGIIQDKYKSLLGQFDAAETDRGNKNKEAAAKEAARQEKIAKNGGFDEYNKWRHESAVRSATNAMDPTFWLKQAGVIDWSINDKLTDGWEGLAGKAGIELDSDHVNMGALDPLSQKKWPAVYNDLTQEELVALENMSSSKQQEFIKNRFAQMGGHLDGTGL